MKGDEKKKVIPKTTMWNRGQKQVWNLDCMTVLTFNQQPIAIQNSFGDNTICPCELTRDFIARVTAKEGFSIDLIIHSNPVEINQFFVTSLIGNILNQFCFSTSERALLNIIKKYLNQTMLKPNYF